MTIKYFIDVLDESGTILNTLQSEGVLPRVGDTISLSYRDHATEKYGFFKNYAVVEVAHAIRVGTASSETRCVLSSYEVRVVKK